MCRGNVGGRDADRVLGVLSTEAYLRRYRFYLHGNCSWPCLLLFCGLECLR